MATAQLGTLLRHIHRLAGEPPGSTRRLADHELLDEFAARRDEAAFTALVARHGSMVLRVCRRVLGHEHDAEDAFQAAFLVLAKQAGAIRKREALASWLHGVAFRTAMRVKRSAARRRKRERQLRRTGSVSCRVGGDPAAYAAGSPTWDEVQAALDQEIQRLPPLNGAAFVLCVLEGKSRSEAAAQLRIPEGTVWSRIARARRLLQRRLARRGIELSVLLAALSVAEGVGRAALPAALTQTTIRFGLLVAAGESAAGVIPTHIAALAAGVTRAMVVSKAKFAFSALLLSSLFAACGLALTSGGDERKSPASAKPLAAEKPQATQEERAVEVRGRVLNPADKPVAGAKLYQAFRVEFIEQGPPPAPRLRGTSDADGRFHFTVSKAEFERDPKEVLQVIAVKDGFGPDWADLAKLDGQSVTLRLAKDMPITGRIVDLEGRPIRGATIRLVALMTTLDEDLTPWFQAIKDKKRFMHRDMLKKQTIAFPNEIPDLPRTIATDAEGRFRLTGVGRERVVAVLIGGPKLELEPAALVTRDVAKFQVFDNPQTEDKFMVYGSSFEHVAAPAKPIFGTVRDKDTGKPLSGVRITVDADPLAQATTDKDGKYRLGSLRSNFLGGGFGIPLLAIPPEDQPYLAGFVEVKRGPSLQASSVDFGLKRGLWVTGKVTNQATGKPVRASVWYEPATDNSLRKDAADFSRFPGLPHAIYRTRPDGTFRIAALPGPGIVTVEGPYGEFLRGASEHINPSKDGERQSLTFSLDPGRTITGTVLDPDGNPLPAVYAFNVNPRHFWTSQPLEKPSFTLIAVDPREHRMLIFVHPERRLAKTLEVPGNAEGPVAVRLEQAGTATGRLVDEAGQPRPDVDLVIHLVTKDGGVAEHLHGRIATDREGRFRVEGLAPGVVYQVNLRGKAPNLTIGGVINKLTIKAGEMKDLGDVKGKLFEDQAPSKKEEEPPALDPDNPLDMALLRWQKAIEKVQTASCKVSRTDKDSIFKETRVFEGTFKYMKPRRWVLEVARKDNPQEREKWLRNGPVIYRFDFQDKKVFEWEIPAERELDPLVRIPFIGPLIHSALDNCLFCFLGGMKAEDAKRRFALSLTKGKENDSHYVYIDIQPREDRDKADFEVARLVLIKETYLPRQFWFRHPNRDETTWDIPKIETDVKLTREVFMLAVPKGWKLVEFPKKRQ
jgi:TIGR03009 family protein